jgi:predicted TPR repeat methyltransferase
MAARDRRETEPTRGLAYAMDERLAPHYERHIVEDCRYRTPDVVAEALAALGASGLWLDIGAGTGLVGKAALRAKVSVELVAVDVSQAMLDLIETPGYVARHRADAAEGLPFDGARFDGVVAAGLFEHIADPARVLRHAARVVKPGGGFAFTFPPNDAGRTELFDADEGLFSHDASAMRALLASFGLETIRDETFPAYVSGSKGWVTHQVLAGLRSGPTSGSAR